MKRYVIAGAMRLVALTLMLALFTPLAARAEGQIERESPELVAVNMADTHSAYDVCGSTDRSS